jgi:hypothetical protein
MWHLVRIKKEAKMNKLLIVSFFLLLQTNCNSQRSEIEIEKQYSCILDEVQMNKVEPYGIEFKKKLSDTLLYWVRNIDNSFMRRYKKINYQISDYVLFNEDHSKGLGFVVKFRMEGELLDFIDIITGEKSKNGIWQFFYSGVPSLSFDQYGDSSQRLMPISKEAMERRVLEMIVEDGYYKRDCKRDYNYFESRWFPEWIKKKHKEEFYKPD